MRSSCFCKFQYMNRLIGLWFDFLLISEVIWLTNPSLLWQNNEEVMNSVLEFSVKDQAS